jgi:hypothetical protein
VSDPPDLRASDAERERTVAELREHALAGRLTVEELDERCERAYAARTRSELRALLADLPKARVAVRERAPGQPADPGGIGRRPFTYVSEHPVAPARAMQEALRTMAPALARAGYELVHREELRLEFDYAYRPGWVAVPIILLPPIGLLALLIKEHDRVVVDFDAAPGGGTRMVVHGRAPRRVRRAFAELS